MSKLSPTLKALISAPFARAGTTPAPPHISSIYKYVSKQAESRKVAQPTWLALATAATMTMNSPESLSVLHSTASAEKPLKTAISNAELMREVGLKCIGFNGVPRTINCLNAFRASLPQDVGNGLTTKPSREPSPSTIDSAKRRGMDLWTSIYRPFETKLVDKLAHSHPDLPVHILNSEYGLLFADPPRSSAPGQQLGRLNTSVVAVACLRAQTGVGPQVTSHLFGLRKALEDGSWKEEGVDLDEEGVKWLAGDEGGVWILESVDRIVEAIGGGKMATSFAPARAKL